MQLQDLMKNRDDIYRHLKPFPFVLQNCYFLQEELPILSFAKVLFRFFKYVVLFREICCQHIPIQQLYLPISEVSNLHLPGDYYNLGPQYELLHRHPLSPCKPYPLYSHLNKFRTHLQQNAFSHGLFFSYWCSRQVICFHLSIFLPVILFHRIQVKSRHFDIFVICVCLLRLFF